MIIAHADAALIGKYLNMSTFKLKCWMSVALNRIGLKPNESWLAVNGEESNSDNKHCNVLPIVCPNS